MRIKQRLKRLEKATPDSEFPDWFNELEAKCQTYEASTDRTEASRRRFPRHDDRSLAQFLVEQVYLIAPEDELTKREAIWLEWVMIAL